MDHYIDIKLKPDAEMRENLLLNKAYSKLHKALHTLKSNDIGVSFPRYQVLLGDVLRLHGKKDKLTALQALEWLGGLSGYCQVSGIQMIPNQVSYRIISRKQANMTEAKLRRLIKRHSISADKVKAYKAKMFSQGLDNPYVELESSSTGERYRRYFEFGEISITPTTGNFDYFGLSQTASVVWF